MQYALLGDIHSSLNDLQIVLNDIEMKSPEAIRMGTGDLFECTISKKDITDNKFSKLEDVMIIPKGFVDLLRFPSVQGNQEERIILITETNDPLDKLAKLPETLSIGNAEIIHGHQWQWGGNPWSLLKAETEKPITFYGHSHHSSLTIDGTPVEVKFATQYKLDGEEVLINVGAVISDREWVLYDSEKNNVTFMKA